MRPLKIRWGFHYGRYNKKYTRRKKLFSFKTYCINKDFFKTDIKKDCYRFKKRQKLVNQRSSFFKTKIGFLRISFNRRNIFVTLSTTKGQLLTTITTGILNVKGKERQATHIIRATANLIITKIQEAKLSQLIYIIKGNSPRRKKKLFYDTLRKIKPIKFKKLIVVAPRAHNGCRPAKIRRL
ncbi:MAG TPA: 30S ribosomal protein S11 [Flavobacterium sp.]